MFAGTTMTIRSSSPAIFVTVGYDLMPRIELSFGLTAYISPLKTCLRLFSTKFLKITCPAFSTFFVAPTIATERGLKKAFRARTLSSIAVFTAAPYDYYGFMFYSVKHLPAYFGQSHVEFFSHFPDRSSCPASSGAIR